MLFEVTTDGNDLTYFLLYHEVVYQTARTDLLDLRNREMLSVSKVGRKWVFTAPEDLETKLSGKAS